MSTSSPTKPKYHVALSFAGEDRDYVKRVAAQLKSDGVSVFYDDYEEAALWGKDLYAHLTKVRAGPGNLHRAISGVSA